MSCAQLCSRKFELMPASMVLNVATKGIPNRQPVAILKKIMEGHILKPITWFSTRKLRVCGLAIAVLFATTGGGSIAADKPNESISVPNAPELPQTPETVERVMQLEA